MPSFQPTLCHIILWSKFFTFQKLHPHSMLFLVCQRHVPSLPNMFKIIKYKLGLLDHVPVHSLTIWSSKVIPKCSTVCTSKPRRKLSVFLLYLHMTYKLSIKNLMALVLSGLGEPYSKSKSRWKDFLIPHKKINRLRNILKEY